MLIFNYISDLIVGPCSRRIPSEEKSIYLTFDDGPSSYCTPKVLDLLKKYNAQASFFLIGNKIEKNIKLVNRIKSEGHTIGNHSIDHDTKTLFKGKKALEQWIDEGDDIIFKYTGEASIGFRPPVGIRTPELRLIMKQKNEKPIMWQHRFFDTTFNFTDAAWKKKFHKIKSGDIVLLHDTHQQADVFLASLENFIKELIQNNFKIKAINPT